MTTIGTPLTADATRIMLLGSGDPYGASGRVAELGVLHGWYVAQGEWCKGLGG